MRVADRRMLQSDAFAWYMEKDPVLRSTVVAIVRLDRSPDWERLRSRIDRLTRLAPQLRQRVRMPPIRFGPPWWTVDTSFDLDYHVRRLRIAEPGDWSQVLEFTRVAAMKAFDRARPLWEFTLIEGLADGGAALVTKLHHSLTDGIGGVQLSGLVLDAGPKGTELGPLPETPDAPGDQALPWVARSLLSDAAAVATAGGRRLTTVPSSVTSAIRRPVQTALHAVATAESVGRFVAPVSHQQSTVLGDRHTRRLLVTMDVPFADLHDAAAAAGGHLNDAYVAALAGGLASYHERRHAPLLEMRVVVPVSIRTSDDAIGGNRITLVRMKIPAASAEPAERITAITAIMAHWRREPALQHTQEIAFGLNLLPRAYLGGIFKRIELVASDVPGLPRQVWLAGAKVTGYYPFGPTIGSALNATLMSYDGVCNIGLNIDTDAVAEPAELVRCIDDSFAEIFAIATP